MPATIPDATTLHNFQEEVWSFYANNKRQFSWRKNITGYHVLLSEIMLQQTQVQRIAIKFPEFLARFETIFDLANASLADVLVVWQGLGYNRRGKFLWETANIIVNNYHGQVPSNPNILKQMPGIGMNTAGSIVAFAYNLPTIFIETNIRRVFIHHFFPNQENVDDKHIMPLIELTVDKENAREWYWALMDYGTYLKKTLPNPNKKSKHYTKQSEFEGSNRQVRSTILRLILTSNKPLSLEEINNNFPETENRIEENITSLIKENMIEQLEPNVFTIKST